MRIEDLVARVLQGEVHVPSFQRPLKWEAKHVLELLDSIYRGFPVGALLFWKKSQLARIMNFGAVRVESIAREDALMVVDGQQRITSLVAVLCHPDPEPRGGLYGIWFDLENLKFERLIRGLAPPTWIPLNVVIDAVQLSLWVDSWAYRNERPDLKLQAFSLGKRLREYELPSYVVATRDEQTVRRIFQRTNTSGVSLDEQEVFDALHGRPGKEKPLAAVRTRLSQLEFGAPAERDLLLSLKIVGGIDPKVAADHLDFRESESILSTTEVAFRKVLHFLSEDVGVPHLRLLPYAPPLAALARFFARHPDPLPRTRTLLATWLWRGAVSSAHSQAGNHAVSREWVKLIGDDEEKSAQLLLRQVGGQTVVHDPLDKWNSRHARTRLFTLFFISQGAIEPATGRGISFDDLRDALNKGTSLSRVYRPSKASGNVPIAGHFLLPGGNIGDLWDSSDECRASHGLSDEACAAARAGDFKRLHELRAAQIGEPATRFFEARTSRDLSDRSSLDAVVRDADARLAG